MRAVAAAVVVLTDSIAYEMRAVAAAVVVVSDSMTYEVYPLSSPLCPVAWGPTSPPPRPPSCPLRSPSSPPPPLPTQVTELPTQALSAGDPTAATAAATAAVGEDDGALLFSLRMEAQLGGAGVAGGVQALPIKVPRLLITG